MVCFSAWTRSCTSRRFYSQPKTTTFTPTTPAVSRHCLVANLGCQAFALAFLDSRNEGIGGQGAERCPGVRQLDRAAGRCALGEAIRDGRVAASIAAGILAVVPGIRDREGCGAIQAGEVHRHGVRTSGRQVERDPRRVGPVRQSGRAVPAVAGQCPARRELLLSAPPSSLTSEAPAAVGGPKSRQPATRGAS